MDSILAGIDAIVALSLRRYRYLLNKLGTFGSLGRFGLIVTIGVMVLTIHFFPGWCGFGARLLIPVTLSALVAVVALG
jgi:hypothetical protein